MSLNPLIRQEMELHPITISGLARKAGFTHSFISLVVNDKTKVSEKAALQILTRGFDYKRSEAKDKLARWRIEGYKKDLIQKHGDISEEKVAQLCLSSELLSGPQDGPKFAEFPISMVKPEGQYYLYEAKEFRGRTASDIFWILIRLTHKYAGPKTDHVFEYGNLRDIGKIIETSEYFEPENQPKIPKESKDFRILGVVEGIFEKMT